MYVGNMKFLVGALDTSLKYIWTFSIVLIFIHIYNVRVFYTNFIVFIYLLNILVCKFYYIKLDCFYCDYL